MLQWMYDAIRKGGWSLLVSISDFFRNAVPNLMQFILEALPPNLNASLTPYVDIINALNQWCPLSETVYLIFFSFTWDGWFWCFKFLLRCFTFGFAGRS